MAVADHVGMHSEHRCQLSENALWRDELSFWHQELEELRLELPKLEAALRDHEAALLAHAATIECHEQKVLAHEHALAEYERGGSGETLVELSQAHQREETDGGRTREAHERVKRYHHRLVARWRMLVKATSDSL